MFDDLADIVRFHRKKSGLTQADLAKLAGIGKAAVYDLEHRTKSTRIDTIQKVLRVLNITVKLDSPIMHSYQELKDEASKGIRSKD